MTDVRDPGREHVVDAGGVKTRYWESGTGEPLVLIHGGGAGADARGNWSGCFPYLTPHFRVIAYDMVGFGQSVPDNPDFAFTQPSRIDHLAAFLDALGLERASFVGNSMGGATALGLAMRNPERIATLTLMGSAGLTRQFSAELSTMLDYTEPSLDGMRRIVGALTHPRYQPSEELVQYRYQLTQDNRVMDAYRATMAWIREQGGLFYPEEDIARVKSKTLVVSGREDQVVPLDLSVRFHQLLDNSRLCSIAHCGHWAMLEHPDKLASAVVGFIDEEENR
ncbi:alpha/beta hydrolase [Nocardioides aromaticivorans]|uniref:Alpha/beta hydrolase n=1 Tax=Nocardioides aromaticivorans TaxID=200618 RepID=Q2HWH9_9ACTN|nr:alpha/beta hydrolase [Nocardioides aromaticivorans]QSR24161.1 alpha/beta hydrolase [Nocardioides aromaticivorans]BAE79499.1 meta-cleavage compound hydrolase [Nocardioides aromaticivorans]